MVKVSDVLLSAEDLIGAECATYEEGDDHPYTAKIEKDNITEADGGLALAVKGIAYVFHDTNPHDLLGYTMQAPEPGTYFRHIVSEDSAKTEYTTGFSFPSNIKHLDEKFLPESVDGVVVRSSNNGSTKKFKITVNDDGVISAVKISD